MNSTRGSAIATGTIRGAQVAVGPGGRVHVAWNASDNTGMLYARSNDQGTAFEPQRNLIRQTSGIDGGGGLAVDPGGNVYVAWHASERDAAPGEAGRRVWVARSEDEGRTFATERPAWDEPTGACGCCGMAFSADGLGNVYALYRSARELVHRDVAADGRSASPAISPPGDARSRKHPRLAVNSAGEVLLVWTEGTAWARGGSLAWRLFGPDGRALAESGVRSDLPAWSFGAAAAQADGTFTVFY